MGRTKRLAGADPQMADNVCEIEDGKKGTNLVPDGFAHVLGVV